MKPYIKRKKWLVEFDMIWMRFVHSILETDWCSKASFVSWKMVSWKSLFKLSCVCLSLEKLINRKHFSIKEKFDLVSWKVFSSYFRRKTLFQKLWKNSKCHVICWLYQIWSSNFWLLYILFEYFFFNFIP